MIEPPAAQEPLLRQKRAFSKGASLIRILLFAGEPGDTSLREETRTGDWPTCETLSAGKDEQVASPIIHRIGTHVKGDLVPGFLERSEQQQPTTLD